MLEDNPEILLYAVLGFQWVVFAWNEYLSLRQRRMVKTHTEVPPQLEHVLTKQTLENSRLYSLDKGLFSFFQGLYSEIEMTVILVLYGLPWLWNKSGATLEACGFSADSEILQSLVFVFYISMYNLITGMPWSVYSTFVLEAKHNFNKQTPGFFIKDTIKKFVVMMIIMMPLLALLIWIIQIGGDYFFLYAWLFTLVISVVLITVYPAYIAPLFDKFTRLPEGALRESIEKLASSLSFPLDELFLLEGSKRSSHSNAYFVGLIKKRIVLFDTLLAEHHPDNRPPAEGREGNEAGEGQGQGQAEGAGEGEGEGDASLRVQPLTPAAADIADNPRADNAVENTQGATNRVKGCTNEEALAVLGHELGHWSLWHIPKNFLISNVNTLLCFAVFGFLYQMPLIYHAFGFNDSKPILVGMFIIFQFIFQPYEMVLSFCMIVLSRRYEFQADEFAVKLEKDGKLNNGTELLKSALIQLQVDNLGFPYSDWLYSAFNYSHPPILDRLAGLDKAKKKVFKAL